MRLWWLERVTPGKTCCGSMPQQGWSAKQEIGKAVFPWALCGEGGAHRRDRELMLYIFVSFCYFYTFYVMCNGTCSSAPGADLSIRPERARQGKTEITIKRAWHRRLAA